MVLTHVFTFLFIDIKMFKTLDYTYILYYYTLGYFSSLVLRFTPNCNDLEQVWSFRILVYWLHDELIYNDH